MDSAAGQSGQLGQPKNREKIAEISMLSAGSVILSGKLSKGAESRVSGLSVDTRLLFLSIPSHISPFATATDAEL